MPAANDLLSFLRFFARFIFTSNFFAFSLKCPNFSSVFTSIFSSTIAQSADHFLNSTQFLFFCTFHYVTREILFSITEFSIQGYFHFVSNSFACNPRSLWFINLLSISWSFNLSACELFWKILRYLNCRKIAMGEFSSPFNN